VTARSPRGTICEIRIAERRRVRVGILGGGLQSSEKTSLKGEMTVNREREEFLPGRKIEHRNHWVCGDLTPGRNHK